MGVKSVRKTNEEFIKECAAIHNQYYDYSKTNYTGAKNKVTGSDGYFEFLDLTNQQYTITAQKNGYSTDRKNITTVAGDNAEVTFTLKKLQ